MKNSPIERYCDFMEEIKLRTGVITTCLASPILPPRFLYETCFLQFRYICELIALSCLVAHGEVPGARSKRLSKQFDASSIINQLERLHPAFYPRPSRQVVKDGKVVEVHPITSGYLTKDDLKNLYTKTGDVLHRGSLRSVLDAPPKKWGDEEVRVWLSKIITLLNHHQISLIKEGVEIWVLMASSKDDRVHAFTMVAQDAEQRS